jgi:hypothetical protein
MSFAGAAAITSLGGRFGNLTDIVVTFGAFRASAEEPLTVTVTRRAARIGSAHVYT